MSHAMIAWWVCAGALLLGAWWDWQTRRIPIWLPAVPLLVIAWPRTWPLERLSLEELLGSAATVLAAVLVLWIADVGAGDLALMVPIALVLGVWVVVTCAVSLLAGLLTLWRRGRPDDPFVPHLLVGFLLASGLRWGLGG